MSRHLAEVASSILVGATVAVLLVANHGAPYRMVAFMVCASVGATLLVAWRPGFWSKFVAVGAAFGMVLVSVLQSNPLGIWVVAALLFLYFVWVSTGNRSTSDD